MQKIIKVEGIYKSFKDVQAVNGINFEVEKGDLFAFLGPNGAGKSTTIDMMCTFLKPDAGKISINNYEVGKQDGKVRGIIGVVFQESLMDSILTVRENLMIRGGIYGMQKRKVSEVIEEISHYTDLGKFIDRKYGTLSGGQKRRADIARALLHRPEILILDEPTTGLDPQSRLNIWEIITRFQKEYGMTVFLTTHYLEEAEKADRLTIIDDGRVIAEGTPKDIKEKNTSSLLKIYTQNSIELTDILLKNSLVFKNKQSHFSINVKNSMNALDILNLCHKYFYDFEIIKGSMNDAFINLTGKDLRDI